MRHKPSKFCNGIPLAEMILLVGMILGTPLTLSLLWNEAEPPAQFPLAIEADIISPPPHFEK